MIETTMACQSENSTKLAKIYSARVKEGEDMATDGDERKNLI